MIYLSGFSLGGLSEVRTHVLLKVEISEFISLLKLQKSSKLGVRVNLASIFLVLKSALKQDEDVACFQALKLQHPCAGEQGGVEFASGLFKADAAGGTDFVQQSRRTTHHDDVVDCRLADEDVPQLKS